MPRRKPELDRLTRSAKRKRAMRKRILEEYKRKDEHIHDQHTAVFMTEPHSILCTNPYPDNVIKTEHIEYCTSYLLSEIKLEKYDLNVLDEVNVTLEAPLGATRQDTENTLSHIDFVVVKEEFKEEPQDLGEI